MKKDAEVYEGGSDMSQLMKDQGPPEWWLPSKWQAVCHNAAQSAHLPDPHLAAQIVIKDVSREHEVSLKVFAID